VFVDSRGGRVSGLLGRIQGCALEGASLESLEAVVKVVQVFVKGSQLPLDAGKALLER
jgi:hypothetical protein